jgi:hypothetical protein
MILFRWGSQLGPIALGLALRALMTSYGPTKLQRIKASKLVYFRRWGAGEIDFFCLRDV